MYKTDLVFCASYEMGQVPAETKSHNSKKLLSMQKQMEKAWGISSCDLCVVTPPLNTQVMQIDLAFCVSYFSDVRWAALL